MEQMRFEQGDLQQEAPKRIKKRQLPRRRLRALAVVAAAVLAVVAAFVLLDRTAFDGLRRSIAYMQAEKDESGCARLFQYSSDGSSRYADLNGSLLVASANEITLLDDKGNAVYHTALQFSQVALSAADGQAAVYEIGGRTLYLLNSRGLVQQMDLEGDIFAVQMGRSGIDYLAGGGLLRSAGKKKDRPDAYRLAEENGYTVVRTVDAFDALKRGAGKTIVISPEPNRTASLPYAIDRRDGVPTLAALTARGIELLDNPNGFFLMVEGGMIDWACHANDAATAVAETLAFRDAVAEAVRFADAHPDETLIIVTADHETGGLTLGQRTLPYGSRYGLLKAQKVSFQAFSDELRELKKRDVLTPERMRRLVTERFGLRFDGTGPLVLADEEKNELDQALEASLHPSAESKLRCGGYEPLAVAATRILAAKAGIGWTTYAHTALTFARGVNAELFSNYYDNTHIAELIRAML